MPIPPALGALVESGELQLSLFDERDLFELRSAAFPGERLVACRNPLLAEERARKRESLLRATEAELETIARATRREKRRLVGRDKIGLRVGRVLGKYKVGKHFVLEIEDHGFSYRRDEERVRAHAFICMLAYYVVWHMRQALAPLLFQEDDPLAAQTERGSVVAPAQRSASARRKAKTKRTDEGLPVHSLETLLDDLATLTKNRMRFGRATFDQLAQPTRLQQRAFELLNVPWRP